MRYRSVNGVIWHGSAQKVIGNQRIGVKQLRESKRDCVKSTPGYSALKSKVTKT